MSSTYIDSSVRLPNIHALGFVGQSRLADEAMCRSAINQFLAQQNSIAGRIVCGLCSIAPGGDLIFAESCLDLGIPLRLLLPLRPDRFLSDCAAPERSRFERVIDGAITVEIVGTEQSSDSGERRYECGLQTVQQCQHLLAVWNGKPTSGLGGVSDIIEFAGQMRRPVVWIDSETGVVQSIPQQRKLDQGPEDELSFLNHLPGNKAACESDDPVALGKQWLAKLDANAAQLAPQVRRLAAVPIVCTALAAFVSGAAQGRHVSGLWIAAGALLGLTASLLPAALKLGKRQSLWVRIRTAAEVTRSILALWDTPVRYQVVGPEILPELNSMIRSLDFLKAQAGRTATIQVAQFKDAYIESRLLDQVKYFSRQSKHSAQMGRRYRLVSKICVVSAILLSIWAFAGRSAFIASHMDSAGPWLPLLASALFQIATIAGALLVVNECERRERRYREIHRSLADWQVELRAFHTWPPVIEVVSKIERALLVELLEWRSLLQNMKMPRN